MKGKLGWTVFLLVLGYAGYYLCRSNFSVAKPLLLEAFPDLDKAKLGLIASVGTFLYAIGKLVHGPLADRFGGKPLFLYGMFGAIAFCLMFGLGGPPLFMLAWAGNRFVQSSGWGGMVRIVANWTPAQRYGRIMGLISLSYLFGDFASRLLLGGWVRAGAGWQDLFLWSSAGLALIAIPTLFLLRERPEKSLVPFREAPTSSRALFATRGFAMVCALSFVFTLLRETFNEWTPLYLQEQAKMSAADAGQASSLFPLFGGLSVLAVGFLSDRMADPAKPDRRLRVIPAGLAIGGLLLAFLAWGPEVDGIGAALIVAAVAFVLIGPYSLLAGATSLDFGKDKTPASAAGWIDGIGYLGGILSGYAVGQIAQSLGWRVAMGSLGAVCVVSAVGYTLATQQRKKLAR